MSPRSILPRGLAGLAILLATCASPQPPSYEELAGNLKRTDVEPVMAQDGEGNVAADTAAALDAFRRAGEVAQARGYTLGPGDLVTIDAWGQSELSGQQTVGPDGFVTLPVVGDVRLGGLDRASALNAIRNSLGQAYPDVVVTLRVDEYRSYRLVVLGSVNSPGVHAFDAPPNLLRALGSAGGLRNDDRGLPPQQATIMRGGEAVLWVDLDALLREGDMSLNVPLVPGDIVHVAEGTARMFYVLGEVANPGIYPLRAGTTVIDAIALAGGTTEDADDDGIRLLRPTEDEVDGFDYEAYARGDFEYNLPLGQGDVVYVPTSVLGEVGYFFRQVSPLAQILFFYDRIED
jgi:polysaccharide export outer membrane protein